MSNRESLSEAELGAQLALAAEALRAERLEEVRHAVDRLVAAEPDDVRVQNLRGLYYFRLERYGDAQKVYRELSSRHPKDTALRLNLGLTELKLGDHAAAVESLRRVIVVEPNNQRAQGYLGLALMRAGDLRGAQKAFTLSGQHELQERVAMRLRELEEEGSLQRTELERAATIGSALLDGEQPFVSPEHEDHSGDGARGAGRWQVRAPGERVPLPTEDLHAVTPPLAIKSAEAVASFASARMLRASPGGEVFALAEGGMLVTSVFQRVYTRTSGAVSSAATLTFEPLRRRVRGQVVEELFGDEEAPMFTASGRGMMLVAPRGGHFVLLRLEDDIVYVREQNAFSFDDSLGWENGRMPGAGPDVMPPRLVQFRGQGSIVLRSERPLFTLKIDPNTPHIVETSALAGWFGRVLPKLMRGENGEPTPYVECSGEGALLIEEPRA